MSVSVWGVDHGDEVSKALGTNWTAKENPRKEGLAYKDKAARKRTSKDIARRNAYVSPNGPNRKENWSRVGRNAGPAAAGGAGIGAATGAAITRSKGGAGVGAAAGGYMGALYGAAAGTMKNSNKHLDEGFRAAKKRGDFQKKNYKRFKLSPVND